MAHEGGGGLEPRMSEKRDVSLVIKPHIEGLDDVEGALGEAMAHIMAAQNLIESARAATLTVTALAELDETTD